MKKRTYADVTDTVILSIGSEILQEWVDFESRVFESLQADPQQRYDVLLNVGSGRRISESEQPFFDRFQRWFLVEPDDERRRVLASNVQGKDVVLLADRVELLGSSGAPPADFVLCKYVLQHIETSLVVPAARELLAAAAPGGKVGIFLALAEGEDPMYQMVVPVDAFRHMPRKLRRAARKSDTQASVRLDRSQFDEMITGAFDFPFIATHHFGRQEVRDALPEFELLGEAGGNGFLVARR